MRSLATASSISCPGPNPSRFHRSVPTRFWFFHAGSRAEMVTLPRGAGGGRGGRPSTIPGGGSTSGSLFTVSAGNVGLGVRVAAARRWAGGGRRPDWTLASCVLLAWFRV